MEMEIAAAGIDPGRDLAANLQNVLLSPRNSTLFYKLFDVDPIVLFEGPWFAITIFACAFVGYCFGTLMFAFIICRVFHGFDIRDHCTRNVGGLNVRLTTGSMKWFALVVLGDIMKAIVPIVLFGKLFGIYGRELSTDPYVVRTNICWLITGFIVLLGHRWPWYLNFAGGRAQASTLGVMMSTWPHFMVPLLATILMYFLPVLFAQLTKKCMKGMLECIQGNKVLFMVFCFVLIPPSAVIGYQLMHANVNDLDVVETLRGGMPFSITMFAEILVGVWFFKKHINNARKKKTNAFWSEDHASEGNASPCVKFHKNCKVCVLYSKYTNLRMRLQNMEPHDHTCVDIDGNKGSSTGLDGSLNSGETQPLVRRKNSTSRVAPLTAETSLLSESNAVLDDVPRHRQPPRLHVVELDSTED